MGGQKNMYGNGGKEKKSLEGITPWSFSPYSSH